MMATGWRVVGGIVGICIEEEESLLMFTDWSGWVSAGLWRRKRIGAAYRV